MAPGLPSPVPRARHAARRANPIEKLREQSLPELFSDNRGVGAPAPPGRDFTVPRQWERRRTVSLTSVFPDR